jgi:hypothetical protein
MKQVFLSLTVALLMATTGLAQSWEGEWLGLQGDLHGMIELSYQSQYIWRGFDVYQDESAIQPSIDLDLYGTGLGISITGHRANSSGFENEERWDYTLYYQNAVFSEEPYATNYRLGWVYYNFPDHSNEWYDLQELHGILSWPNILPVKGLRPSYVVVKLWPSNGDSLVERRRDGTASGFAHILMLDYSFPIPGLMPDVPEQIVNLHSELVYNDGVHPAGFKVDHDWSNIVVGVSTDFDLGGNVILTPALYYQASMETTVNDDDEAWMTLGVRYTF